MLHFIETGIFLIVFPINTQISYLLQIPPLGAELFHADGRTDGHGKANGVLSQFCDRP